MGGGATQRALAGGKKPTKKEKAQKKSSNRMKHFAGDAAVAEFYRIQADRAREAEEANLDADNAALYGLLRLRLNDDRHAAGKVFPELDNTALIRELHVYGVLVAAREGSDSKSDGQAQHGGIGRTLMATAEKLAASRGYSRIAVIAGVGVRNYYRKLGYEQTGEGQYLIKTALPATAPIAVGDLERPFLEASAGLRRTDSASPRRPSCFAVTLGVALLGAASALALRRR